MAHSTMETPDAPTGADERLARTRSPRIRNIRTRSPSHDGDDKEDRSVDSVRAMEHQDSAGKPLSIGSIVFWRGHVYTISGFGQLGDLSIEFEEPLHSTEVPRETSVDLIEYAPTDATIACDYIDGFIVVTQRIVVPAVIARVHADLVRAAFGYDTRVWNPIKGWQGKQTDTKEEALKMHDLVKQLTRLLAAHVLCPPWDQVPEVWIEPFVGHTLQTRPLSWDEVDRLYPSAGCSWDRDAVQDSPVIRLVCVRNTAGEHVAALRAQEAGLGSCLEFNLRSERWHAYIVPS